MEVYEEDEENESASREHLVVIRHGDRMQPSNPKWIEISKSKPWDIPLSSGFEAACRAKAAKLPDTVYGLVAISPFKRCAQTAAALLPHVKLDAQCAIYFHRGLSEVFSMEFMFPRQGSISMKQKWDFWRWRSKRDQPHPDFSTLAGVQVQGRVLGEWPEVPETSDKAQARFIKAIRQLEEMARGTSILVITHAQGVETAVGMVEPGRTVETVDTLGHIDISRVVSAAAAAADDDGQSKGEGGQGSGPAQQQQQQQQPYTSPWRLVEPAPHGDVASRCGVTLLPERGSAAEYQQTGRGKASAQMEAALARERLALTSNPWWAMTD